MKRIFLCILSVAIMLPGLVQAQQHLRLATTTSTDNSGLLAVLHPPFEAKYHIKVDVIAVGTGKALRLGRNGDVDLVLVHAPGAEKEFVADGFGIMRLPVMHNDFVLLGPPADPAGVKQAASLSDALKRIATTMQPFVSRGDDSGTHKKEKALWKSASLAPAGDWYLSTGQGMGAVLKIANDKLAYTLSDRGTYLAYRDKIDLNIVYEGDPGLFNPYHVILINPKRYPHVQTKLAQHYVDFIRGKQGQQIIREFRKGGEQLFHPDVTP
ncbi:MAG: substrate-binding domain-containing protein [Gammaproteobacteria bacterium]